MSLLDVTHDDFRVGDRVRCKAGMHTGRVGTLEEIDRTVLFSHLVRWDGVQGLWPCYRFDLQRITPQEQEAAK